MALDVKSGYIMVLKNTIETQNEEKKEKLREDKMIADLYIAHTDMVNKQSENNTLIVETEDNKENNIQDGETIVEILSSDSEENELIETVFESEEYSTPAYDGSVLTASSGVNYYGSQRETYYNLDMSGCIDIMHSIGNTDEYWVRDDGVKMLGSYIMCAANLNVHPRGSLVETSLGTAIVVDTGGFADSDPYQIDIAVTW
ncbi:MAG: hypothetical protein ACLTTN_01375 [Coprococcus eutactus]